MRRPPTVAKAGTLVLLLLGLLLIPSSLSGEESPPLWSLSDEDTTVYLFGTIHLMTPEVDWLRGELIDAFRAADLLVLEIDQTKLTLEEQRSIVEELALLPQDTSLSDLIEEEQMCTLTSILSSLGAPREAVERWEPWFAALTVTSAVAQQAGFLPRYGVDATLLRRAMEAEKEILGLETAREQFRLFDELSREEAIYFLQEALEERDHIVPMFEKMKEAWLKRDLDTLAGLLLESREENPEFFDTVYADRNRAWSKAIVELMERETGTILVAVGAGHFVGKGSVIEFLEGEGYEVTSEGNRTF
jgi:hypothetical protein